MSGYPAPWRARYEQEMLALLEDSPAGWRDLLDLARGLLVERARALMEPGDHPILMLAAVGLAGFFAAAGASLAAAGLGWMAGNWLGPLPAWWDRAALLLHLIAIAGWIVRSFVWATKHGNHRLPPPMPIAALAPWIGAALLANALAGWAGSITLAQIAMTTTVTVSAIGWRRASWRIHAATLQLSSYRHEMKWALMELERCERLVAQGDAAPADEARANVSRIQRLQEETLAGLHAMGYRATFH